jgi:hypothetical protein
MGNKGDVRRKPSTPWTGLPEHLQRKLELELCRIELRQKIYAELPDKKGVTNFIGRVIDRTLAFIRDELPAGTFQFKQVDLAPLFGLKPSDIPAVSKLLAGKQNGGAKRGFGKRKWIEKSREVLSHLVAGCKPADLKNGTPAKRIDHYFFRDLGEIAIWSDVRRGSIDCWCLTEFSSEIHRAARTRQLYPVASVKVWFVSGGPPFFAAHNDDLLLKAAIECASAGAEIRFVYLKPHDGDVDAEYSVDAFRRGMRGVVGTHDIDELPIATEDLSPSMFINPVTQYAWLDLSGRTHLWILRPEPADKERHPIGEPLALRGRVKEQEAFSIWIDQLRESPRWKSRTDEDTAGPRSRPEPPAKPPSGPVIPQQHESGQRAPGVS